MGETRSRRDVTAPTFRPGVPPSVSDTGGEGPWDLRDGLGTGWISGSAGVPVFPRFCRDLDGSWTTLKPVRGGDRPEVKGIVYWCVGLCYPRPIFFFTPPPRVLSNR